MSLSTLRNSNKTKKPNHRKFEPPIPFEKDPPLKFAKSNWRSFDIPVETGSEKTMEVKVPVLEKATCEQYLAWFETVTTVLNGMDATALTAKFNIIEQLCKGYMKEKFCAARDKLIQEVAKRATANPVIAPLDKDKQYCYAVQDLTKAIFPKKAVMLQRHYMQYYMKKTSEVTVVEYRARVTRLMSLLKSFPPFGKNQSFSEDEHKSLVYFNFPKIYTDELTLQGFDFTEGSVDDLYC